MLVQPHRPVLGISPATHVPGDDGACSTAEDWLTNKQVLRRFGSRYIVQKVHAQLAGALRVLALTIYPGEDSRTFDTISAYCQMPGIGLQSVTSIVYI